MTKPCPYCKRPDDIDEYRCNKCGTCWLHCKGHERNDGVMDMTYRELETAHYFEGSDYDDEC